MARTLRDASNATGAKGRSESPPNSQTAKMWAKGAGAYVKSFKKK